MARYVAWGRIRGGLLNDPRYNAGRSGSGLDAATEPAASLIMFGHPWLTTMLPSATSTLTIGDKRFLLGLYSGSLS